MSVVKRGRYAEGASGVEISLPGKERSVDAAVQADIRDSQEDKKNVAFLSV